MARVTKTLVEFHVWAPLGHGESVRVCGDTTVLGCMDPEQGVPLHTDPSTYPVWSSPPVAVFQREVISYKYAVWSAGKFDRWELFEDQQAERKMVVEPELLPKLPDGTRGDTLNVADLVNVDGLLEWRHEDEPCATDCDAATIAEASSREAEMVPAAVEEEGDPPSPSSTTVAAREDRPREDRPTIRDLKFCPASARREATVSPEPPKAAPKAEPPVAQKKSEKPPAATWRPQSPQPKSKDKTSPAAAPAAMVDEEGSSPLAPTDGVVVVSVFLPVIVELTENGQWAVRWDTESLLSLQAPLRVTRVGIARVPPGTSPQQRTVLAALLRQPPWNCIAIFLDSESYKLFYHEFCKGVLWPVFHNSLEVFGEKATPGIIEEDEEEEALYSNGAPYRNNTNNGMSTPPTPPPHGQQAPSSPDAVVNKKATRITGDVERAAAALLATSSSTDALRAACSNMLSKPTLGSDSSFAEVGDEDVAPPLEEHDSDNKKPANKRQRTTTRTERAWHAYKRVNQVFRDYVVEAYNEGDLIWIHGFQLALLPAFVSRRLTVARVGLFLHTPFPSSEIFRSLSMRVELLRGMLSADQIGFHLFEYARHFITTCKRVLGVRSSFDNRGAVLSVDGRDVCVCSIHAGVEPFELSRLANDQEGRKTVAAVEEKLLGAADKKRRKTTRVIAGIDRLERLRGLPLKLLAYDRFLDARKAKKQDDDDNIVLVQYAIVSSERSADCENMRRVCRALCERIRANHGADCLVWREVADLDVRERLALLRIADVFWVSSVRDGLNRWPLEYVAMQSDLLLGPECFLPEDTAQTAAAKKSRVVSAVRRRYFDDVITRMINACGGPAYPCEDPCAFFVQKEQRASVAASQPKAPRLADEIFPTEENCVEAPAAAAPSTTTKKKKKGNRLSTAVTAYNDDETTLYEIETDLVSGRKFFTVELHKKVSQREKRHVKRYLETVPGARERHAERNVRCNQRRVGALLLSENASATRVLLGAVSVNPWRIEDSVNALEEILSMPDRERAARHARDAEFLVRSTTAQWAFRVLCDLKALPKDANRANATHAGLGLNFRVLGMRSGFDALQVDRVAKAYRVSLAQQQPEKGGARCIVLDYGGTLVPDAAPAQMDSVSAYAISQGERSRAPRPSAQVISVLKALSEDPRNLVFVVSGRERADLIDGFGKLETIPNLGLCAEHGYFLKWPRALKNKKHARTVAEAAAALAQSKESPNVVSSSSSGSPTHQRTTTEDAEWERLECSTLNQWRPVALSTMEVFVQRTQGTYVEKHESSLVWQYRDADPDYGEIQAKELETQLAEALAPWAHHVCILSGANPSKGGYVEVRPAGVDKGELVTRILRSLVRAGRQVDFALVVGDDASDEPMFASLAAFQRDQVKPINPAYFSVCIGKKPSEAECYVDTHDDLVELLQACARVSHRGSRFHSSADLVSAAPYHRPLSPPPGETSKQQKRASHHLGALAEINPVAAPPEPAPTNMGRSVSMPAFLAPTPGPHKVPSWVSFQEAINEVEDDEEYIDDEEEQANAAMFF